MVPPAPASLITHETEETPARNVSPYSVRSLVLPVAAPPLVPSLPTTISYRPSIYIKDSINQCLAPDGSALIWLSGSELGCPRKCVFDFRRNTEFFEKHMEFREIPQNSAVFLAVKLPGIPRNSVCICIRNSSHILQYTGKSIKGTVRPDCICMRVVSLESPLKAHQPL